MLGSYKRDFIGKGEEERGSGDRSHTWSSESGIWSEKMKKKVVEVMGGCRGGSVSYGL